MSEKKKYTTYDREVNKRLLITLIKQRPVLWDRDLEIYKDRTARAEAWREIYPILYKKYASMDENEKILFGRYVTHRWTRIRDAWLRSYKKPNATTYKFDREMSFLKRFVDRNSVGTSEDANMSANIKEEEDIESESEVNFENYDFDENHSNVEMEPEKVMCIVDSSKEAENADRHLSFFKGILPSLTAFDDDQTLEFQSGVINLIQSIKRNRNW
ncbi:hypothetical protein evm_001385 [Chilo suppressalis]|nr:hypothetical protein evm_001385 [Chilo suppressalis]